MRRRRVHLHRLPQGQRTRAPVRVGVHDIQARGAHGSEGLPRGAQVFKREMNLVFHMTTHRPKQPRPAEAEDPAGAQPVTCQDCGKTFGTKYQAKKHYLRRHFQGEKPFPCARCGKRFVVKEDLTMHIKSCGHVYGCQCGIRLCSLGALKRHCKHFAHQPMSFEPQATHAHTRKVHLGH